MSTAEKLARSSRSHLYKAARKLTIPGPSSDFADSRNQSNDHFSHRARSSRILAYSLLRGRIIGAARAFYSRNVRPDVQRVWDIRCYMTFHIVQEASNVRRYS